MSADAVWQHTLRNGMSAASVVAAVVPMLQDLMLCNCCAPVVGGALSGGRPLTGYRGRVVEPRRDNSALAIVMAIIASGMLED